MAKTVTVNQKSVKLQVKSIHFILINNHYFSFIKDLGYSWARKISFFNSSLL